MEKASALYVFRSRKLSMTHQDEDYMRLALREAETAFAENEVPVGAVLIIKNRVIASAHNRKIATDDPTSHAEMNVIRESAAGNKDWRLTDSTIYVTKEPCVMCAGAMVNARIGRLVYGCRDEKYGAVTSQYQVVSDQKLNHNMEVLPGILEDECSALLKRFFSELRKDAEGV
jgi:tRNA(adenine34) deaminase